MALKTAREEADEEQTAKYFTGECEKLRKKLGEKYSKDVRITRTVVTGGRRSFINIEGASGTYIVDLILNINPTQNKVKFNIRKSKGGKRENINDGTIELDNNFTTNMESIVSAALNEN